MMHVANRLPTHLVVGVRKSATSWIWKQIENREEVSSPRLKEVHYFDQHSNKSLDWYASHFKPNKIVLDMTPDYFVAGRAKKDYIIKQETLAKKTESLYNLNEDDIDRIYDLLDEDFPD